MMESKIGENIKKCRQEKGIKQGDFAKLFGITSSTLSKIESGRGCIKIDLLKQISEKCEIGLEKLIFGEDAILLNSQVLEKLKKDEK